MDRMTMAQAVGEEPILDAGWTPEDACEWADDDGWAVERAEFGWGE